MVHMCIFQPHQKCFSERVAGICTISNNRPDLFVASQSAMFRSTSKLLISTLQDISHTTTWQLII